MVRGSSADQRSANRRLSASFIARGRTHITPRDRIQISKTSSLQSHRRMGVMKQDCTTRRRNAHGIAEHELLYPWHPWAGCLVHIHEVVEKAGREVFRCSLSGRASGRWLEIPAWMFDRAAGAAWRVGAAPYVDIAVLNPAGSHNHPARDPRWLASGRLSLLLALEVAPTGRATADRHGAARIDPADEHGKPALGRATYPRRTAQARV